jgi:HAD superfamily hydrolase (TIGR01484 family)
MGKFSGVLLASDFDDTFLGRNGEVPIRNTEAVEYFKSRGGQFIIATGRAHQTFAPQLHRCPVNAPVVLSNGAMIYDFDCNTELFRCDLPLGAREDMITLSEAMPEIGFEACHGEDIYVYNPNKITRAHLEKVGTPYALCAIADMPLPWVKVIIEQDHPVLLKAEAFMNERFGERYELVFSNKYLLEMTGKGCHKGSGVLRVAEMLEFRVRIFLLSETTATTYRCLKYPDDFAPADCSDRLEGSGAQIVSSSDAHAVADAVDIIDKLY